jgi:hypothetical protein
MKALIAGIINQHGKYKKDPNSSNHFRGISNFRREMAPIQRTEPILLYVGDSYLNKGNERGQLWVYADLVLWITGIFKSEEESSLFVRQVVDGREERFERTRKSIAREKRLEETESREPIPEETRQFVWRRDEGKCVLCGNQENLEFDHMIPVSKGGSNTERNLQLLCEECNRKKSDMI